MKPPRFRYFAPTSIDEAIHLLGEFGDDAKVLAGGQSLMPLLNMRLVRPKVLVDLQRVPELNHFAVLDDRIEIGAMVRQRTVEKSPEVQHCIPLLAETIRHIGHLQIRNRGTIGGSIAHADPAAELPALLRLLDGWVEVQGSQGSRSISADELFLTYFTTTLQPDEILTKVIFPLPPSGAGWCFQEVVRREGDFALAGVACTVSLAVDGTCREARLALTGVADTPLRVYEAEQILMGQSLDDGVADAVAEAVRQAVAPESDIHASAEYRRHVAGILAQRALRTAWDRAQRGGDPD